MNDFTKDELEIAKDGIGWMISECEMSHNKASADEWRRVAAKFQSMIDNYCEHDYQIDIHHMDIYLCPKCGRREWWENK